MHQPLSMMLLIKQLHYTNFNSILTQTGLKRSFYFVKQMKSWYHWVHSLIIFQCYFRWKHNYLSLSECVRLTHMYLLSVRQQLFLRIFYTQCKYQKWEKQVWSLLGAVLLWECTESVLAVIYIVLVCWFYPNLGRATRWRANVPGFPLLKFCGWYVINYRALRRQIDNYWQANTGK